MRAVAPNFFPSSAGYADIGCSVKYMRCIALVSPLDPAPFAAGSGFGQESADERGHLSRLLHLHAVPRAVADLKARARQHLRITLTAFQRHDSVVASPDDQGRRGEAAE